MVQCHGVRPRADLVSFGEGGKGALVLDSEDSLRNWKLSILQMRKTHETQG